MKVLHFYYNGVGNDGHGDINCRLQRLVQLDLDLGNEVVLLINGESNTNKMWIPDVDAIEVECFKKNLRLVYLLPSGDCLGLKKIFKSCGCDVVHAHNLGCAVFAHKLGLPVIFDDWEYQLEYYNYATGYSRTPLSIPLRMYQKRVVRSRLLKLIKSVPVIVTNDSVSDRYRDLGANSISVIPNVPLNFEVYHAYDKTVEKRETKTTVYIGNISIDNHTVLRNTEGLENLWARNPEMGDLVVYGDGNYIPHLDLIAKIRECHFNLLFWKPVGVHKFFVQNKAFLASVAGVPTIISESLESTIELLGDYALVASNYEDVARIVESNGPNEDELFLDPKHLLEFYSAEMDKANEHGCSL